MTDKVAIDDSYDVTIGDSFVSITRVVYAPVSGADKVKYRMGDDIWFRPVNVEVQYGKQGWLPWAVTSIEIWGPRLRQDGFDGSIVKTNKYFGRCGVENAPNWASEFATAHMPGGAA